MPKKEYKYMIDGRVRFSEIDHTRKITVPSIINYFQDCSTFQSEDIGVGLDVLSKKKKATEFPDTKRLYTGRDLISS